VKKTSDKALHSTLKNDSNDKSFNYKYKAIIFVHNCLLYCYKAYPRLPHIASLVWAKYYLN